MLIKEQATRMDTARILSHRVVTRYRSTNYKFTENREELGITDIS
jgi:hypothetical protein